MPRQFFTLKSILTAPAGTFGDTNGLGGSTPGTGNANNPVGAMSAVLQEAHGASGTAGQEIAMHDVSVIEIDDGESSDEQTYDEPQEQPEDEQDLVGAPPTADEEVLFQDEPNYDDEVDITNEIPPHAQLQIAQMQEQMQMMAQELNYHQQQRRQLEQQQQQLAERPPEPEIPPPVARFANVVVYDGSFEPLQNQVGQILSEAINEVMRLRARAAEAFERQAEEMLGDLAMTVLGRELRTEPADLSAIVAQMRARMAGESPLMIRVAPEDAKFIQGPVKEDESLGYGDLVFEVEDGELDLRLGTRIAAILRAQQVQI